MRKIFHAAAAALTAGLCLSASAQNLKWEPDYRFPGTFFPVFAVSLADRDVRGPTDTDKVAGFPASAEFGVKITGVTDASKIKVRIDIPDLKAFGEVETQGSKDGSTKLVVPRLSLDQRALLSIAQPMNSEVVFTVYQDGVLVGEKRQPIRIRAINDAPLKVCVTPQQCRDYSPIMAAFVNENHPAIDALLRDVLNIPVLPVKEWVGTQAGEEKALDQVWAIWYYLQRHKFVYSSITAESDVRADLASQTIRPLSQAMRTQQANCIDGTAVFASILRKIGIEPIIVLVPGHAFLGFYVDAAQKKPMFLETTMLDKGNPFERHAPSKFGMGLANAVGSDINMKPSQDSFRAALAEGQRKFDAAKPYFGKPPFAIIPIGKAREAGIMPLPL